jgi:hypothetical protein
MPYSRTVSSGNDLIANHERIAVKAGLITILTNVIAPTDLAGLSIERKESSNTRPDEHYISHDRG